MFANPLTSIIRMIWSYCVGLITKQIQGLHKRTWNNPLFSFQVVYFPVPQLYAVLFRYGKVGRQKETESNINISLRHNYRYGCNISV